MDAALRRLVTAALRGAALWSWRGPFRIADRWGDIMIADVAFPTARLALDLGSSTYAPGDPARTRLRLTAAGWTLTHYPPAAFQQYPRQTTQELRALLDALTPTRYP